MHSVFYLGKAVVVFFSLKCLNKKSLVILTENKFLSYELSIFLTNVSSNESDKELF